MESEAAAVPGYVNRPVARGQHVRVDVGAGSREGAHRPAMRIALVALRAYEQRTERRAAMHAWLTARAARGRT